MIFLDYYNILEISIKASQNDIKKAYRNKAIKWHPDKNIKEDTTNKMQEINEAYLILGNPLARTRYDCEYKIFIERRQNEHVVNEAYNMQDKALEREVSEARIRARDLAKQALDDLIGMSNAAITGAANEIKSYKDLIILLVVVNFIFIALYLFR